MAADSGPLTLEDLRRELRRESDWAFRDLLTKADLYAFETRFTFRLIVGLTALGVMLVAVDRLWT